MVVGDVATGTEVLVIGAGPGGYVAAIRAAQLGREVTLVEKGPTGGTCLNDGCIPAKALLSATDVAERARGAEDMGIHADVAVDVPAMMAWKDGVVDRLTQGVEQLCEANDVTLLEGTATFVDEHTARVAHGGEGQGSETLEFDHAIIATGGRPTAHPAFDFEADPVWRARDALAAEDALDELVVVGVGYIALEVASIFARVGTRVKIVSEEPGILPGYEADVSRIVRRRMGQLGVEFHLDRSGLDWRPGGDGIEVVSETDDGETDTHSADRVVVAVGREPVTEELDLDAIGVETDDNGFIDTDWSARTECENVLAVGDVTGEPMLAHAASAEGIVAAGTVSDEPSALDHQAVPTVVYTDPEIATVGLTDAEAREAGYDPVVGTMRLRANGRALTLNERDGFVRLVADAESGFVLGGQIVAPHASELIGEIALAMELAATVEDIGGTVHAHPTLSEAIMEAAENARDRAIHTLNR